MLCRRVKPRLAIRIRMRLLPEVLRVRLIGEALMERHGRRQHFGIVRLVDDRLAERVNANKRRRKFIEAISAAALPVHGLRDTTAILARDHLVEPHLAMRIGVVAHLNANPPPPHLMRNRRGRPRSQE